MTSQEETIQKETIQKETIQKEAAPQDWKEAALKPAEVDLAKFLEIALSLMPAGFPARMIGVLVAILSSVVLLGSPGCKKQKETDAPTAASAAANDSGSIGSIDLLKEKMDKLVQNILKFIVEIELADQNGGKYRVAGLKMNSKTIAAFADVFYSGTLDPGKMTITKMGKDGRVYTFWPPKTDQSLSVHASVEPQEGIVFFASDQGFEIPGESTSDLLAGGLRDGQSVFIYSPFTKTANQAKVTQTKGQFTSIPTPEVGDIVLDENGQPCGFGGPNGKILPFPTASLDKFGLNHGGTLLHPAPQDKGKSEEEDLETAKSDTDIPGLEAPKRTFFPSNLPPEPNPPEPPPTPQKPDPQPKPPASPPPEAPPLPPTQPPTAPPPTRVAQTTPPPPVQPPIAEKRPFVPVIPMYDPNFKPPAEPRQPRANPVATASSIPQPNPGNQMSVKMAGSGKDFALGHSGNGGRGLNLGQGPGNGAGTGIGTIGGNQVSIPMAGYREWVLPAPKRSNFGTDGFGQIHGLGKIDTGGGVGVGAKLGQRKN